MSDFKVDDRVEYVDGPAVELNGKQGVVVDDPSNSINTTYVQFDSGKPWGCMNSSIRHAPAPDVITINRADLPESTVVIRNGRDHIAVKGSDAGSWLATGNAALQRRLGLEYLAAAEAMEAYQLAAEEAAAAEKESAAKLDKRRDELAVELLLSYTGYRGCSPGGKRAIDRIIQLEDAATK